MYTEMLQLSFGVDSLSTTKFSVLGHNNHNRSVVRSIDDSSCLSELQSINSRFADTSNVNSCVLNILEDSYIVSK